MLKANIILINQGKFIGNNQKKYAFISEIFRNI